MVTDTYSHLNKHDKVYHDLVTNTLLSPRLNFRSGERSVVSSLSHFGPQVEYDISDNSIPLSGTKPIAYRTQLFPEIVGFLRNENNLKWYLDQGMKIWTANAFNFYRNKLDDSHPWKSLAKDTPEFRAAQEEYENLVRTTDDESVGDLGNFYPKQWRSFTGLNPTNDGLEVVEVDQIENVIEELRDRPTNRYAVVTAWNPVDVKFKNAALSPCHNLFQAYRYVDVHGIDRVDVKLYQRSADLGLGVPFNAPQYTVLTAYLAALVGSNPGRFIHTFGDLHIYTGQGERAQWYESRDNLVWLQSELRKNGPKQTLGKLLERLPSEGDNPGYDHVPFLLEQLTRKSHSLEPAKLEVTPSSLDNLVMSDLNVINYPKRPSREIKPLVLDGVKMKMAS